MFYKSSANITFESIVYECSCIGLFFRFLEYKFECGVCSSLIQCCLRTSPAKLPPLYAPRRNLFENTPSPCTEVLIRFQNPLHLIANNYTTYWFPRRRKTAQWICKNGWFTKSTFIKAKTTKNIRIEYPQEQLRHHKKLTASPRQMALSRVARLVAMPRPIYNVRKKSLFYLLGTHSRTVPKWKLKLSKHPGLPQTSAYDSVPWAFISEFKQQLVSIYGAHRIFVFPFMFWICSI